MVLIFSVAQDLSSEALIVISKELIKGIFQRTGGWKRFKYKTYFKSPLILESI